MPALSLKSWGLDSRPYSPATRSKMYVIGVVNALAVYLLLTFPDERRFHAALNHLPMPAPGPYTLLALIAFTLEFITLAGAYFLKAYEDQGNIYLVATTISGFVGIVGSFMSQMFIQPVFFRALVSTYHIGASQWIRLTWSQYHIALEIEVATLLLILMSRIYLRGKKFSSQGETSGHYGRAKWASYQDITSYGLRNKAGSLIGKDAGGYLRTPKITDRLILAARGGGKTSSVIVPFILDKLNTPKFILDIKGELTAVTALKASERGRNVCVLDPFKILKTMHRDDIKVSHLNPFAGVEELMLKDPIAFDRYAASIVASLWSSDSVAPETGNEQHFNELGKAVLEGVIHAYVKGRFFDHGQEKTLSGLYDKWLELITSINKPMPNPGKDGKSEPIPKGLAILMQMMNAGQGVEKAAAAPLLSTGGDEKGGIITTVSRQLQLFRSAAIRESFRGNSADVDGFLKGTTDIYLILPADQIRVNSRLVRSAIAFLKMKLLQMDTDYLQEDYVFVLDELGQFGYSPDVTDLITAMRSWHVKTWAVFQTYDQIKAYRDHGAFTSMPVKQFLGNDDVETMEWVQKLGGNTTVYGETISHSKTRTHHTWVYRQNNVATAEQFSQQEARTPLIDFADIRELPDDEQIVFLKSCHPIRCKKAFYFKESIYKHLYDDNPFEGNPTPKKSAVEQAGRINADKKEELRSIDTPKYAQYTQDRAQRVPQEPEQSNHKEEIESSVLTQDVDLKLTIELVPSMSWYVNVRDKVSKDAWDQIRKQVYRKYNYRCAICGAKTSLHCHELWNYNDDTHVQSLKGYMAICEDCHHIKHFGHSKVMAERGDLNIERVIDHFMRVNNCTREVFDEYLSKEMETWEERSQFEWQVELNGFDKPENALKTLDQTPEPESKPVTNTLRTKNTISNVLQKPSSDDSDLTDGPPAGIPHNIIRPS